MFIAEKVEKGGDLDHIFVDMITCARKFNDTIRARKEFVDTIYTGVYLEFFGALKGQRNSE